MWDCDGNIYILPDNDVLSTKISMPMLPRLVDAAANGLKEHVKAHCDGGAKRGSDPSSGDNRFRHWFLQRFHPVQAALYGHRLWKGGRAVGEGGQGTAENPGLKTWECLDNPDTFTRDLVKLWEALTGKTSFEMPASCPYYYWDTSDNRYKGRCEFAHTLMEIGADVQVSIRSCPRNEHFFRVSIGCQGGGCSLFRGCTSDADCASPGHLACSDLFEWIDPKSPQDGPKFTDADLYDILRDYLFLYEPTLSSQAAGEKCKDSFSPRRMAKSFFDRFGKYIVGSPEHLGTGATCSLPSSGEPACRVCLPVHTYALEASWTDIPGRWKEKSSEYPKKRMKYAGKGNDTCGVSAGGLQAKGNALLAGAAPKPLMSPQPDGTNSSELKLRMQGRDSALARGAIVELGGEKYKIGGASCTGHAECGTAGVCISAAELCALAGAAQCLDLSDQCQKVGADCGVRSSAPIPDRRMCACFVISRGMDGGEHSLVYGKNCELAWYMANPDLTPFGAMYTEGTHAYRPKYDPLLDWDGVAADGENSFRVRDHWAKWPKLQSPAGEGHVASVQCDGVIQLFMRQPYAVRLHMPRLPELVAWYSNFSWSVWQCRGETKVEAFRVANTLPWRPEGWLWAKVFNPETSGNAQPPDWDSFLKAVFPPDRAAAAGDRWDWRSRDKLLQGPEDFHLANWISTPSPRYSGFNWSGMPTVLGSDWWMALRFEECTEPASAGGGLVRMDLTCGGKSCDEYFRLAKPCAGKHGTPCQGEENYATCRDVLSGFWEEDFLAGMLWGTGRPVPPVQNGDAVYTATSLCPMLETWGKEGSTSKATSQKPLYAAVAYMWDAMRMADCRMRDEADCWGSCGWDPASQLCLGGGPHPSVETTFLEQKIKWCVPHVYPMPEALGEAAAGPVAQSDVYAYESKAVVGRGSAVLDVFNFAASASIPARPASYDEEEMYPVTVTESSGYQVGTSFIIVMITMGIIICIAAFCVWFRYVRVTPDEKERLSRLQGLTFNWKAEHGGFGRDQMYPSMCRDWLPDGEVHAEEWEERMRSERPAAAALNGPLSDDASRGEAADGPARRLSSTPASRQTSNATSARAPPGARRAQSARQSAVPPADGVPAPVDSPGPAAPAPLLQPLVAQDLDRNRSRGSRAPGRSDTDVSAHRRSSRLPAVANGGVPNGRSSREPPQRVALPPPRPVLEVDTELPPGPPPPGSRAPGSSPLSSPGAPASRRPQSRDPETRLTITDITSMLQKGGTHAVPQAVDAFHASTSPRRQGGRDREF